MTVKDKKEPGLLYLSKTGLQYCVHGMPAAIGFNFPPTLVRDLEIKSLDELATVIKSFIDQAKLVPAEFITIISDDLCIQKDFEVGAKKETEDILVDQFIDALPFDYVHTKTFKLGKITKVIAVNRDFYESIQSTFAKNGFTVGYTLLRNFPGSLIAQDSFGPGLLKKLQGKQEWIKQNDFAGLSRAQTVAIDQEEKTKNNKNTWILLAIMGLMIAILVTMVIIFKPFGQEKPKHTIPSASEVSPETITTPPAAPPTPVAVPETPQASVSAQNIKIEILNASGVSGQADTIRKDLVALGFNDISTGTAPSSQRSTVNYSPTVSSVTLDKVVGYLRPNYPSLLTQSAPNLPFDIVVTLGKDRIPNQTTP